MSGQNGSGEFYTIVTAEEFDGNPADIYRRATFDGPVTVRDAQGRPSMTLVVPRLPAPADGE